jgi:hypothetical protein
LRTTWLGRSFWDGYAMLNSRLVREQDAHLYFEVMGYLISQFGAPPRPPVPSPLHKSPGLELLAWNTLDTRSIFDWADDHFGAIKSECHMTEFDVDLLPAGEGLDSDQLAASHRLDALAAGRTPYRQASTTPILYDPRDCSSPGHFTATTILQLAELRVVGFSPDTVLSSLMQRMVTLTAAAFNRQGFVLANLPREVSAYLTATHDTRAVPHRIVLNTLCFATCLALRVRRQSAEQIIATYGTRMTKSFRRKVRQACRQIDSESEALAVLQMLAEPKARQRAAEQQLVQSA